MSARLTIFEGQPPTTIHDAKELNEVLSAAADQALSRGLLAVVFLQAQNGNELSIVVGGTETALGFDYAHRMPPYFASKGSADEDDPVMTCFAWFTHHTEFPRRCVIRWEHGLEAAQEFVTSGDLPGCIEWQEV